MWFVIGILLGIGGSRVYHTYIHEQQQKAAEADNTLPVNQYRSAQKERNLSEVLDLFKSQREVRNHDIQNLIEVSPKTARNYCDELEKENLITQHGDSGRDVYYTFNR